MINNKDQNYRFADNKLLVVKYDTVLISYSVAPTIYYKCSLF